MNYFYVFSLFSAVLGSSFECVFCVLRYTHLFPSHPSGSRAKSFCGILHQRCVLSLHHHYRAILILGSYLHCFQSLNYKISYFPLNVLTVVCIFCIMEGSVCRQILHIYYVFLGVQRVCCRWQHCIGIYQNRKWSLFIVLSCELHCSTVSQQGMLCMLLVECIIHFSFWNVIKY